MNKLRNKVALKVKLITYIYIGLIKMKNVCIPMTLLTSLTTRDCVFLSQIGNQEQDREDFLPPAFS